MSASVKEVEQRAVEIRRPGREGPARPRTGGWPRPPSHPGMDNIKKAVEASAEVINRLGKRSQEIGQILKVIDEVTDQTGLLA